MAIAKLDYYRWKNDQVLRKAMENPRFLSAFFKRCERDEEHYCICFSDAVHYRIPREIINLESKQH